MAERLIGHSFPAGDERISGKEKSEKLIWSLCDADAGAGQDASRTEIVRGKPQAGFAGDQIASVVAGTSDAECLCEATGAAGEITKIAGMVDGELPGGRHGGDSGERFKGAEKNASGLALGLAGNIQAVMIAVDEIHVSVPGRSEDHGISGRFAGGSMGGRILRAEIGFEFHDASGANPAAFLANQNFAKKVVGDPTGIAIKESPFENAKRSN